MQWLGLVLALVTLANSITSMLQRRGIISGAEADLVRRVLALDEGRLADVKKARDRVRADAAAGKLRDDDGHKRD